MFFLMKQSTILLLSCCICCIAHAQSVSKPYGYRPQLIRGPYLQAATDNSVVIRWRTDASARSRVRYGTTAGHLDKMVDDITLVTEHQIKLTGLQPATTYYYSIGELKDT